MSGVIVNPFRFGGTYATTGVKLGYYSAANNFYERAATALMPAHGTKLSIVFAGRLSNVAANGLLLRNLKTGTTIAHIQLKIATGPDLDFFKIDDSSWNSLLTAGAVHSRALTAGEQSGWGGYIFTVNGSTGVVKFSRNGTIITESGEGDIGTGTLATSNGQFNNRSDFGKGGAADSFGDFSHVWISSELIDAESDYSKFFDGSNKPIDVGADGSIPTGTQPEHFAPDGDLTTNAGSEANWTEVGTVVASATSPTD